MIYILKTPVEAEKFLPAPRNLLSVSVRMLNALDVLRSAIHGSETV
jgi:hypothetical protein